MIESSKMEGGLLIYIGATVLLCVLAYLLGSINFGIIVSGKMYKDDVRNHGSGNAGATNMLRTYGKKAGAITLLGDLLKGFIPVMLARVLFGITCCSFVALASVLGHVFPVFYKFKGGKGVATTAGVVLALDWRVFLILVLFFVIIVVGTKFVSLGSVIVAMLLPIMMSKFAPAPTVIVSFIIGAIVVVKHWQNIKRLYKGDESKISFKSKKKPEPAPEDGTDGQ